MCQLVICEVLEGKLILCVFGMLFKESIKGGYFVWNMVICCFYFLKLNIVYQLQDFLENFDRIKGKMMEDLGSNCRGNQ